MQAVLLNPTVLCVLTVAGLGIALFLSLYLFCTLKMEVRAGRARLPSPVPPELADLRRRLEDLESRPGGAGAHPDRPAEVSTVAVRPGMNLSRRSQALRLARRRQSPEQIASMLGLATGEVRLLLKIHGMLMQQAVGGPHPSGELKPEPETADISSSASKFPARLTEPI